MEVARDTNKGKRNQGVKTAKEFEIFSMCVLVSQSCPTLCDAKDCSLPGSSVHGIQVGILEWIAISFVRGSSQPRNPTQVSRIAGQFFTI